MLVGIVTNGSSDETSGEDNKEEGREEDKDEEEGGILDKLDNF